MPRGVYVRVHKVSAITRARMSASNRRAYEEGRRQGPSGWRIWEQQNPEQAFKRRSAIGKRMAARVWRCDEPGCGRVITGPGFFMHQRARQHNGSTRLDLIDRDNQGDSA